MKRGVNKRPMTKPEFAKIKELYVAGYTLREISFHTGRSYQTVRNIVTRNRVAFNLEAAENGYLKPWAEEDIKTLKREFRYLPRPWKGSAAFSDLCRKLNRVESAVVKMVNTLRLKKYTPRVDYVDDMKPPPTIIQLWKYEEPKPFKRPEAVYTNLTTPYGIATELHAGNRKFKNL